MMSQLVKAYIIVKLLDKKKKQAICLNYLQSRRGGKYSAIMRHTVVLFLAARAVVAL